MYLKSEVLLIIVTEGST